MRQTILERHAFNFTSNGVLVSIMSCEKSQQARLGIRLIIGGRREDPFVMCVWCVFRRHGSQSEPLHSPTPKPVHAGRLASLSHRGCSCSQSSRLWLRFLVYVPRGNCPVYTAAAYKLAQMNIPHRQPTPHGSEDGASSQACRSVPWRSGS